MHLPRITKSRLIRITLLVLAACAVGLAVWVGSGASTRQDMDATLSAQQMALANYVARDVDYKVNERSALLANMAATLPVALLEQPVQLRQWLADQHRLQPLFTQGLFVADTTGKAIADFPQRTERTHVGYADRDYIRMGLLGDLAVGRPVIGRVTNEPVLPMAAPIKDASGAVRAVLVGITALATPGFLSLTPHDVGDESADFMLISPQDQLFVASTQADMVLKPTPAVGVDALVDRAMGGFRGTGLSVNSDGLQEVAAIASVPSTGWFVVARNPAAEGRRAMQGGASTYPATGLPLAFTLLLIAATGVVYAVQPKSLTDRFAPLATPIFRLLPRLQSAPSANTRIALHDALTGLPNRALLSDRLTQALARAHRKGARVGLITLDLDHFKSINDTLGSAAGDVVLKEVARRLAAVVRESDTLAHVDADQFAVVMSELDSDYDIAKFAACAVAAKCLDAVLPPINLKGAPHQLGASAGIALSHPGMHLDDLQTASHRALTMAKQAGGDRYFMAAEAAIPASPAMASA